ncbi:hypothetical protein M885DRAFT_550006 [Pelagophyceae sp. CCMP2097]|nr:hypothetical protein M885DRAFT_550006 [Pelagophyceae sp. CCMP2097]
MAAAQFAQPYYVLNGALVVSWAVLRSILPGAAAIKKETSGSWFSTRETEIVMLVGFALLSKAKRSSSSHEFASKVFMFGKTAVLLCLWYSSWVAFGAYAALMALVFTVVPTPSFAGTEHVEDMTTAAFEARVLRDGAQDKAGIVWVVMFGADWCEPCTNALPLFASLAQQFKSRRRQFARVHVDKHPSLAARFVIDTSYKTKQLPTFILFHGGRELKREPLFNAATKQVTKHRLSRDSLEKYFLLTSAPKDVVAHFKNLRESAAEKAAPTRESAAEKAALADQID